MSATSTISAIRTLRRRLLLAAALAPVLAAVHYAAYWLRFEGQLSGVHWSIASQTLAWFLLTKLIIFGWFGVYRSWSRFVTFHDLVTLAQGATVASLLLALENYLFPPAGVTPRSVFLIDWGATIFVVGGLRCFGRLIEERGRPIFTPRGKTPVLIVGANAAGESLLRAIRRNQKLPYRVVGFIVEDAPAAAWSIGGVPVLGTLDETVAIAQRRGAAEVLIAAGGLSGQKVRRLVEEGRRRGVEVKVLPSYEQLLQGRVDLRPRTVSIADLLHRSPVQLNLEDLHEWIEGRTILVTGAAGSIGSEICRQLLVFRPGKLVMADRSENGQFHLQRELRSQQPRDRIEVSIADVRDRRRMENLFQTHRPHIVFHAAAYKHVPLMEANVGEAVKNIALATQSLADLAERHGAGSFVLISTDKAVNPTSVMGACKRVAELYVQSLAAHSRCRFVTVRFGNVLDSSGSVVPTFRQQIAQGGPVTITHPEVRRYFMTIPEASQLVIQAGAMGRGGEIFVLDMGEPIKIVDLAADMIRLSGLRLGEDIQLEYIGLRPGEKLVEELHGEGERRVATSHPKILVAESESGNPAALRIALQRLGALADGPEPPLLDELRRLVPRYRASAAGVPLRRAA